MRSMLTLALLALATPAAALVAVSADAALLTNGSFEAGPTDNNPGFHRGAPAPDGWSTLSGYETPDIISAGYTQGGPPFLVLLGAEDGSRFLDMNGASPIGGLFQDVSGLTPGSTATLSFYWSRWAQNSAGSLVASLIDPTTMLTLATKTDTVPFDNTVTQSSWMLDSFTALVPLSGIVRVEFTANSGSSDRGAPGLDNVKLVTSVVATPEPAHMILFGLAVAAAGLIAGNRRRG